MLKQPTQDAAPISDWVSAGLPMSARRQTRPAVALAVLVASVRSWRQNQPGCPTARLIAPLSIPGERYIALTRPVGQRIGIGNQNGFPPCNFTSSCHIFIGVIDPVEVIQRPTGCPQDLPMKRTAIPLSSTPDRSLAALHQHCRPGDRGRPGATTPPRFRDASGCRDSDARENRAGAARGRSERDSGWVRILVGRSCGKLGLLQCQLSTPAKRTRRPRPI